MTNLFEAAEQAEKEERFLEVRIDQQVGTLAWNFEELNTQLDALLEKYHGLIVSDREAKEVRAQLNKLAKAIDDRRLKEKKAFCEPYDIFAAQAKQLVEKIKETNKWFDDQVKEAEARRKEERLQKIREFWAERGRSSFDLGQIFNDKWLNASTPEKQWQNEILERVNRIDADLAAITQMEPPEKVDWCITAYRQTVDLGRTLAGWESYQEEKARSERIRAEIEADRARRRAEAEAREAEKKKNEEEPTPAENQPKTAQNEPVSAEKTTWWSYTISLEGTTDQMKTFAQFIKESGIKMTVINRKKEEK